jgi:ABC-type transport system substrate-binding protein
MRNDRVRNALLLVIAVALVAIAVRPYVHPAAVGAQSVSAYPFYIEPGVQMLIAPDGSKQVYGKVVVDLRDGKVWGFPTGTLNPYPSNAMNSKPTVSRPFVLGQFAFEDVGR